jgi:hypothetical protein
MIIIITLRVLSGEKKRYQKKHRREANRKSNTQRNEQKPLNEVHPQKLSQHFILAPLREVKSSNRRTLESGQSGMLSDWLPVSLTPFHHPRWGLGW